MKDIVHKVAGLTGMHTVRRENDVWQCTCQGFKFHGHCKHIEEQKTNELIREIDRKNEDTAGHRRRRQ